MKRLFKILGITLGVLALLLGGFAAYISLKGIPHYEVEMPAAIAGLQAPGDSLHVARGAKIATLLCNECHKGEGGKLTGKEMPDMPANLKPAHSLNITQDKDHGIGAWTDGELYYFLRTGIRKDGSWAPPFMPKFPLLADEDLLSIIAWLRSDDPALAPDRKEYPPNDYNLTCRILSNTLFSPPPMPTHPIIRPEPQNQVATGRYLANDLLGCYHCHSGDLLKVDGDVAENSFRFYGGGAEMKNENGEVVRTANLTPDPETGIGQWTEQQFTDAVRFCKNPRGGMLHYPMSPYSALSEQEAAAIWAYLKTVPPIHNPVDRYKSAEIK